MGMLKARLYEEELQRREAASAALESAKTDIGWGHQIRSYVLAPYQLVKDLRTGVEKGNPDAVLDGDLDAFMAAALASRGRRDPLGGERASALDDDGNRQENGLRDERFQGQQTRRTAERRRQRQEGHAGEIPLRPGPDDPAVKEREAERKAIAEARAVRAAERQAAREAEAARQAEMEAAKKAEEAARLAAEAAAKAEEAARQRALLAEQKAARDARYARRKAKR